MGERSIFLQAETIDTSSLMLSLLNFCVVTVLQESKASV